jgi:hypothetical protein
MAFGIDTQYAYSGRGPLDSKALVKTYAELLNTSTWLVNEKATAYNGMLVAVWLNKDDTSKNGIYFLHDPNCTSALKAPDVTVESNWQKLGSLDEIKGLSEQVAALTEELNAINTEIDTLQETATVVYTNFADLPETGISNKLYVVSATAKTYVWVDGDYLPVGDGAGDDAADIQIIHGGGPSAT